MGDRNSCYDLKAGPFLICINLCRISNRFLLCIHNLNLGGSFRVDFTTTGTGNSNSHGFFNERYYRTLWAHDTVKLEAIQAKLERIQNF